MWRCVWCACWGYVAATISTNTTPGSAHCEVPEMSWASWALHLEQPQFRYPQPIAVNLYLARLALALGRNGHRRSLNFNGGIDQLGVRMLEIRSPAVLQLNSSPPATTLVTTIYQFCHVVWSYLPENIWNHLETSARPAEKFGKKSFKKVFPSQTAKIKNSTVS